MLGITGCFAWNHGYIIVVMILNQVNYNKVIPIGHNYLIAALEP